MTWTCDYSRDRRFMNIHEISWSIIQITLFFKFIIPPFADFGGVKMNKMVI